MKGYMKTRGHRRGDRSAQRKIREWEKRMKGRRGANVVTGIRVAALAAGIAVMLPNAVMGNAALTVHAAEMASGTITVTNVKEKNATVTAYQVVDGTYSEENKLTGYVLVDEEHMKLADIQKPTAAEITAIADYIQGNPSAVKGMPLSLFDAASGTWTLQAEPGEYLILVTGSGETIYNPAVAAVNVTDANQMTIASGSVDYSSWFQDSSAYLKSSTTDLQKSVLLNGRKTRGRSAAIGDTLEFVIDSMTIPSYSADYSRVTFRIQDELEGGCFGKIHDLKVLVDGTAVAEGKDTWKVAYGSSKTSFTLEFADAYLRSHGTKAVEIHYQSELTKKAGLNFAENMNTAVLQYSNSPTKADSVTEKTAISYQYTFGLGANIDAEAPTAQQEETNELNKVTKAEGSKGYETVAKTYSGTGASTTKRSKYALEGAEFGLYSDKAMLKKVAESVSDANGHISFTGLQEGDYYLKETAAPEGYAVNDRNYHVTIAAQYRENGSLSGYTVTTKEIRKSGTEEEAGSITYTAQSTVEKDGSITNTVTSSGTAAEILNVPLAELPSTGGSGTFGFLLTAAVLSGGLITWKLTAENKE